MVFWFIASMVVSLVVSVLMAPKAKNQKPAGIEEFDIPTAKLGRDIPVLFGRKMMKSPNVVWYGNLRTRRIRKSGGMFKSKVTVGHKYYLGMHMILCHGATAGEAITLHEIWIGDQKKWSGSSTGGAISISGVGTIDFLTGGPLQGRNSYLQGQLGANIPAFRGVVSVVLRQVYHGDSPYIEPWSFVVSRYPDGVSTGVDARPMSIVREVLTNKIWGMGYNEADIHTASFNAAATTLNNEGFGLSMVWDRGTEISDFVPEILRHVDGSIFIDRTTGQFRVKLVRNDYNIEALPLFDESNVSKVEKFETKQQSELVNTVSVKYHKRSNNDDGSISVQDSALHADMGGTVSATLDYPGVCTDEIAARVAWRDLRALSVPFASCTISTTREGSELNPGDPFLLSWPRYNLQQMVARAVSIVRDGNNTKIECVQDVFGGADLIYTAPPASGWQPILSDPLPVAHHSFIEAPYYWLSINAITDVTGTDGRLLITGEAPNSDAAEAELWLDDGTGYKQIAEVGFSYRTTTTDALSITDTIIPLASAPPVDEVAVGSWAVIGSEIVSVVSVGLSSVTAGRGCLDTVPVAHPSNTPIMFVSENYESSPLPYPTGKSLAARLLTITSNGVLPFASGTTVSLTLNSRAIRPYPPGRLTVDGLLEISSEALNGDIVLTWRHRNRLQQVTTTIVDGLQNTNIGPEAGTTYTVEVRRSDNNALLHTEAGLTGTTATITAAEVNYLGDINIILYAVRDSYISWQSHLRTAFYATNYQQFITADNEIFRTSDGNDFYVEIGA